MSENRSQPAAPDEGAASPRLPELTDEAVEDLRSLRQRLSQGVRSEQDRLDVMVDLCDAFDELDQAMTLGADLPAAWRQGRMIRTVDQLDALPEGSVVRVPTGLLFATSEKDQRCWWAAGLERPIRRDAIVPALLIWHPDWAAS